MKMKKISEFNLQNLGHVSAICILTAALTACGGGGSAGGDDADDESQGLLGGGNGNDVDTDGDGLSDTNEAIQGSDPLVIDTDGDGFNDLQEWDAFTNPNLADTDGDGANDNVDTDPTNPEIGGDTTVVTDPPAADQCDDPNSADDMWTNNCVIKRFGTYAQSSYAQGVQRILWCQSASLQTTSTIGSWADGAFGQLTADAVRDFQTANSLAVDGIVGPETWNSLRSKLSIIASTSTSAGYEAHAISGCDENTAQFYQEVNGFDLLGWKMAATPGSATLVDFSSGAAQ